MARCARGWASHRQRQMRLNSAMRYAWWQMLACCCREAVGDTVGAQGASARCLRCATNNWAGCKSSGIRARGSAQHHPWHQARIRRCLQMHPMQAALLKPPSSTWLHLQVLARLSLARGLPLPLHHLLATRLPSRMAQPTALQSSQPAAISARLTCSVTMTSQRSISRKRRQQRVVVVVAVAVGVWSQQHHMPRAPPCQH